MKACGLCREELPLDAFYRRSRGTGHESQCKRCVRRRVRRHRASTLYGLELSVGLELRHRACDLCGAAPQSFKLPHPIDHDHTTGAVRGVLCSPCNVAVGKIEGRMGGLARLSYYLTRGADYRDVDR